MTRSERLIFTLLAAYVACLMALHTLYYLGIFTGVGKNPSVMIHAIRTFFVVSFFLLICMQILRRRQFGLLIVAAASYSVGTSVEDFLVLESSLFLPNQPLAGVLYVLRPLFVVILVYWAILRRSIETS